MPLEAIPAANTPSARWVLLRGLTREARHWGDFPQQFGMQALGGAAVPIVIDLPGTGELFRATSPADVRGLVEAVRQQLQQRGHSPPYHLLALSLGGMVATGWALRHPDDIHSLVLINTSMRPMAGLTERLRPGPWMGNWLQLARLALHWQDPAHAESVERVIHALTCRRTSSLGRDVAAWTAARRDAPVSRANAWRQLMAAAAFSATARPVCPVLVLSSAADALVHPHCSERLALAWQADHQQHPSAGHDLPHDDADWVCAQVVQWLNAGSRVGLAGADQPAEQQS